MQHRHLTHQRFTLTAIDDIIARGRRIDWVELRHAMLNDQTLPQKVERICNAHTANPYAQRYHFWKHYVQQYLA